MAGQANDVEVVIAGAGMVGSSLALALARAGLTVAVVDRQDPGQLTDERLDGRASAIAAGSQRILEGIGLWQRLAPVAQPILDIRVSDGRVGHGASPLFLHFDHAEVGERPLGYLVENRHTRDALGAATRRQEGLELIAPAEITAVERGAETVAVGLRSADGERRLRARLLVAADGRNSALREQAGIAVTRWDYPQAGIVCTLAHERPHHGVAHEHFLPSGPFAMLPLVDDAEGRHRSSIVWTERRALAPVILAQDPAAFARDVARHFGDSLGAFTLLGRRWSYPLALSHAARYRAQRLALVGDAAHAIHPIAGQGLNLGLRDVAALAEAMVDAARLGLDPGGASVLARYERWRRLDSLLLIAATDSLNRLFSTSLPPLRLVRDLGLAAVDRLPPLKRLFMRHAMGELGELPRLARGEAL